MRQQCFSVARTRTDCSGRSNRTLHGADHRHPSVRLASTLSRLLASLGPGAAGLTVLTAPSASLRQAFADGWQDIGRRVMSSTIDSETPAPAATISRGNRAVDGVKALEGRRHRVLPARAGALRFSGGTAEILNEEAFWPTCPSQTTMYHLGIPPLFDPARGH